MTPLLSVILPVYNGAHYLPQALDSIAIQGALIPYEILAADDGSTDNSLAILDHYAKVLPLRILRGPRVGNWASNSNRALAESSGTYACFLHQDDIWLPGRLAWIQATISAHPEVSVLCSSSQFIDSRGRQLGIWRTPFCDTPERYLTAQEWFRPLLVQNFLAMPSPVFRRNILTTTMPLDPTLRFTADWKLWLTLAARYPVWHCPTPTVAYRLHAGAQTCTLTTHREEYQHQLETVYDQFQGLLPPTPDSELWRHAARIAIGVNLALAAGFHGHFPRAWPKWRNLPPRAAWKLFWHSSRISERVGARIKGLLW